MEIDLSSIFTNAKGNSSSVYNQRTNLNQRNNNTYTQRDNYNDEVNNNDTIVIHNNNYEFKEMILKQIPNIKIFLNSNSYEYHTDYLSYPSELEYIRAVHNHFGEISISGIFSLEKFKPEELFLFKEEAIIINNDFVQAYNFKFLNNKNIYNRNIIKFKINIEKSMKGQIVSEEFKTKLQKLFANNNFYLKELDNNVICLERIGLMFESFYFSEILQQIKIAYQRISNDNDYRFPEVINTSAANIFSNNRSNMLNKVVHQVYNNKQISSKSSMSSNKPKNNIEELFYQNNLKIDNEFLDLNYLNIAIKKRKEKISEKDKVSKVDFSNNNQLVININEKEKKIKAKYMYSNTNYIEQSLLKFLQLEKKYYQEEQISINNDSNALNYEKSNEYLNESNQKKATMIVNDYITNIDLFISKIKNSVNNGNIQNIATLCLANINTLQLFKLLFLNPENNNNLKKKAIIPILENLYRRIRRTLLIKWLYTNNTPSQQQLMNVPKTTPQQLLYYFLTSNESKYNELCNSNGYLELSNVFNTNFEVTESFLTSIRENQFEHLCFEYKIIYEIAYFKNFFPLEDYLTSKNKHFELDWKHILMLVFRFSKFSNQDISLGFNEALCFVESVSSKDKNYNFLIDINYYLISYFCNPNEKCLLKMFELGVRNKTAITRDIQFIICSLLESTIKESVEASIYMNNAIDNSNIKFSKKSLEE